MIHVTLVWSPAARTVAEAALVLEDGACVADALRACRDAAGWVGNIADAGDAVQPGIWGRAVAWSAALEEGDRIELCRPLKVDPKVARRERFARQGTRGTGLFARQRRGGKAGY